MRDPEDSMHKACGWLLREAGKRDEAALVAFLNCHVRRMPGTMLRYAIKKFPGARRRQYLVDVSRSAASTKPVRLSFFFLLTCRKIDGIGGGAG